MKHFCRICAGVILSVFCLAGLSACEKYEKVPENYPFLIRAEAEASGAGTADLTVYVTEGVYSGDCTLSLSLDGAAFSGVSLPDGEAVASSTKWSFNDDGTVDFKLSGLPAGEHALSVSVTRWYHTATCKLTVNAN